MIHCPILWQDVLGLIDDTLHPSGKVHSMQHQHQLFNSPSRLLIRNPHQLLKLILIAHLIMKLCGCSGYIPIACYASYLWLKTAWQPQSVVPNNKIRKQK